MNIKKFRIEGFEKQITSKPGKERFIRNKKGVPLASSWTEYDALTEAQKLALDSVYIDEAWNGGKIFDNLDKFDFPSKCAEKIAETAEAKAATGGQAAILAAGKSPNVIATFNRLGATGTAGTLLHGLNTYLGTVTTLTGATAANVVENINDILALTDASPNFAKANAIRSAKSLDGIATAINVCDAPRTSVTSGAIGATDGAAGIAGMNGDVKTAITAYFKSPDAIARFNNLGATGTAGTLLHGLNTYLGTVTTLTGATAANVVENINDILALTDASPNFAKANAIRSAKSLDGIATAINVCDAPRTSVTSGAIGATDGAAGIAGMNGDVKTAITAYFKSPDAIARFNKRDDVLNAILADNQVQEKFKHHNIEKALNAAAEWPDTIATFNRLGAHGTAGTLLHGLDAFIRADASRHPGTDANHVRDTIAHAMTIDDRANLIKRAKTLDDIARHINDSTEALTGATSHDEGDAGVKNMQIGVRNAITAYFKTPDAIATFNRLGAHGTAGTLLHGLDAFIRADASRHPGTDANHVRDTIAHAMTIDNRANLIKRAKTLDDIARHINDSTEALTGATSHDEGDAGVKNMQIGVRNAITAYFKTPDAIARFNKTALVKNKLRDYFRVGNPGITGATAVTGAGAIDNFINGCVVTGDLQKAVGIDGIRNEVIKLLKADGTVMAAVFPAGANTITSAATAAVVDDKISGIVTEVENEDKKYGEYKGKALNFGWREKDLIWNPTTKKIEARIPGVPYSLSSLIVGIDEIETKNKLTYWDKADKPTKNDKVLGRNKILVSSLFTIPAGEEDKYEVNDERIERWYDYSNDLVDNSSTPAAGKANHDIVFGEEGLCLKNMRQLDLDGFDPEIFTFAQGLEDPTETNLQLKQVGELESISNVYKDKDKKWEKFSGITANVGGGLKLWRAGFRKSGQHDGNYPQKGDSIDSNFSEPINNSYIRGDLFEKKGYVDTSVETLATIIAWKDRYYQLLSLGVKPENLTFKDIRLFYSKGWEPEDILCYDPTSTSRTIDGDIYAVNSADTSVVYKGATDISKINKIALWSKMITDLTGVTAMTTDATVAANNKFIRDPLKAADAAIIGKWIKLVKDQGIRLDVLTPEVIQTLHRLGYDPEWIKGQETDGTNTIDKGQRDIITSDPLIGAAKDLVGLANIYTDTTKRDAAHKILKFIFDFRSEGDDSKKVGVADILAYYDKIPEAANSNKPGVVAAWLKKETVTAAEIEKGKTDVTKIKLVGKDTEYECTEAKIKELAGARKSEIDKFVEDWGTSDPVATPDQKKAFYNNGYKTVADAKDIFVKGWRMEIDHELIKDTANAITDYANKASLDGEKFDINPKTESKKAAYEKLWKNKQECPDSTDANANKTDVDDEATMTTFRELGFSPQRGKKAYQNNWRKEDLTKLTDLKQSIATNAKLGVDGTAKYDPSEKNKIDLYIETWKNVAECPNSTKPGHVLTPEANDAEMKAFMEKGFTPAQGKLAFQHGWRGADVKDLYVTANKIAEAVTFNNSPANPTEVVKTGTPAPAPKISEEIVKKGFEDNGLSAPEKPGAIVEKVKDADSKLNENDGVKNFIKEFAVENKSEVIKVVKKLSDDDKTSLGITATDTDDQVYEKFLKKAEPQKLIETLVKAYVNIDDNLTKLQGEMKKCKDNDQPLNETDYPKDDNDNYTKDAVERWLKEEYLGRASRTFQPKNQDSPDNNNGNGDKKFLRWNNPIIWVVLLVLVGAGIAIWYFWDNLFGTKPEEENLEGGEEA